MEDDSANSYSATCTTYNNKTKGSPLDKNSNHPNTCTLGNMFEKLMSHYPHIQSSGLFTNIGSAILYEINT